MEFMGQEGKHSAAKRESSGASVRDDVQDKITLQRWGEAAYEETRVLWDSCVCQFVVFVSACVTLGVANKDALTAANIFSSLPLLPDWVLERLLRGLLQDYYK